MKEAQPCEFTCKTCEGHKLTVIGRSNLVGLSQIVVEVSIL
ncbi:MAG TPA: hypothetical protein VK856_08325 [Anaerolineaceae bacterium]|nr:hypothetical protein [Anaerolineaceae bacterium]